jgi:thiosulfate reductase cytochrome b subunit
MSQELIYSRFERFWHWTQMVLVLVLLLTGFEVHGSFVLFGFEKATDIHSISGILLIILIAFTIFWHFTTGEWKQYLPTTKNLVAQIQYYTKGIFEGAPKPHKKSRLSKLNPLQIYAYLGLKLVLMPGLILTGLIYLAQSLALIDCKEMGLIGLLHSLLAFGMLAFLIGHVYMTTTGKTPTTNIKAMITGREDLD